MTNSQVTSADEPETHSSDYFEKIPLWSSDPAEKRFEIMNDKFSGRIPTTRLESWRELDRLLESNFFNQHGVDLVFRGHRRFDWELQPTLGRIPSTKGIISKKLADAQRVCKLIRVTAP